MSKHVYMFTYFHHRPKNMFCINCGSERKEKAAKYCHSCGKEFPCTVDVPTSSLSSDCKEKKQSQEKPLTFMEYSKAKSKSWFKKVKGGSSKKSEEVVINVGILGWNERSGMLKPIRGKRVCLRTHCDASYETLRSNALKRMTDFYSDLIDGSIFYNLTFENGEVAYFIPGTTEDFQLSKYKNELGKDYKSITLYLHGEENQSEVENPSKKIKSDFDQTEDDRLFAENLQNLFDDELPVPDEEALQSARELLFGNETQPSQNIQKSASEILSSLSKGVKNDKQFFLTIRRNSDTERVLNIWSRQKKQSPEYKLMVKFIGENGIDSGALSKEFFSDIVPKLGKEFFPGGAPKESMSDVENGKFLHCGQIFAASLAQGGPPPLCLHKSVFDLLLNDRIDIQNLGPHNFTPSDVFKFDHIRNNPEENALYIVDNGYTGQINKENVVSILRTVMISVITRRRTYLEEVAKGLALHGLYPKLMENKSEMEFLFTIPATEETVDATYLISKLNPVFTINDNNRRRVEETFVDYLQDFINNVEDLKITGITGEAIASVQSESVNDTVPGYDEISADLSVAGLLGWFTGQKHRPLFGDEDLKIDVVFDHTCFERFPDHTICFPYVGACGGQLSMPVLHCNSYIEFQEYFLLAFSKGQAFGRC